MDPTSAFGGMSGGRAVPGGRPGGTPVSQPKKRKTKQGTKEERQAKAQNLLNTRKIDKANRAAQGTSWQNRGLSNRGTPTGSDTAGIKPTVNDKPDKASAKYYGKPGGKGKKVKPISMLRVAKAVAYRNKGKIAAGLGIGATAYGVNKYKKKKEEEKSLSGRLRRLSDNFRF